MFSLYVHMCCMYIVANNLILEHFTDLNIYHQEDLECDQMNQSWLQRITVKTQEAPVLETKVAKFTQLIHLNLLFRVCFEYKETFMSYLACHVSHMMKPFRV